MNSQNLILAQKTLLEPAALSERQLDTLLSSLMTTKADSADLYFQNLYQESWSLEDSLVKSGGFNIEQGVGIRVVSGEQTGFAYSEDLDFSALSIAARAASSIMGNSCSSISANIPFKPSVIKPLYTSENPLRSIPDQDKLNLLLKADTIARQLDPAITQVNASLQAAYETILILRHDGVLVADIRPLVRMNVHVIAEKNDKREQGFSGGGARVGYQHFLKNDTAAFLAEEAVRQALLNLEAVPAPAGSMPVVLGPGWPGVLLHEAVGHGLEGDFNRKGSSAFSGRIGESVATPYCTVVDNGSLPNQRGSLSVDDEGTPTQCTTLIENGVLKSYMQDTMNARLMGTVSTGNGRRESYAHLPMPRMTNTYMLPGPHEPEEIIASVEKGLYAANFSGGQVDITSGKFVFSACEAYLIEKGKITRPVKGATLLGNGPEVLTRVSMVGNDLKLDSGVGSCGKEGQFIPVSVGQPTLKVDALTVGGTVV